MSSADVRRRLFRILERTLALIGAFAIVYHLFFHISVVISGSMAPTLQDGDYVLTERITYRIRAPRR